MKRHLIITDHAVLRYLERVGGFEIDRLKRDMTARLQPFLAEGLSGVTIDGHTYVIDQCDDGDILVTVLPKGWQNRTPKIGRARPKP